MHELAIADAVLRIACDRARGRRVTAVELQVGHLRQVVPASLEFSFRLVSEKTACDGAVLRMEEVPAGGVCRACGSDGPLGDFPLSCARCGSPDVEVLRGEELRVDALELEEQPMTMTGRIDGR